MPSSQPQVPTMPTEPPNFEAYGVLVLSREIITNRQTIHVRDIRDVHIRWFGPSRTTWFAVGILLILSVVAFVFGLIRDTGGALTLLLLGGSGGVVLGVGIFLALSVRRKALVIVTPAGEVAVAFARKASALEPLCQAIRTAVGEAGGEGTIPRWGSALRDAADRPPPDVEPPAT
jgi:hypothetical protein